MRTKCSKGELTVGNPIAKRLFWISFYRHQVIYKVLRLIRLTIVKDERIDLVLLSWPILDPLQKMKDS